VEVFKDALALADYSSEKLKKVSLFDTERMFCDVYGLYPGQQQTAHTHAGSDKVYFVLEGRGVFRIGGEERDLGKGYAVLAPAGASHSVSNASTEPLTLLVFMAPKP
jgi:mannose-6-phosphate isomerase-like protein (cupin superfamily)